MHLETEKNLKGSVLPMLERLHAEIKNKTKELTGGAAKGSKQVDKSRNGTQAHIELLGQHTASFEASSHKIDPSTDPYILQRGVYHRLNKQIIEENNNRIDLLAVQDSFLKFEAHVIQTIQQSLGAFNQVLGGQADRTKAMYADMFGTAQKIPPDFEWKGFVHRNNTILLDPSSGPRSMDNISFPNQNHRSTQPLIEGSLERKSRVALKGYSAGYYVITPSKFLHEFKDTDNYRKDPTPELSLYLPDCTVGAVSGTKFTVKGKDSSKGKIGSTLAATHELDFKAHSASDAETWHDIIRKAAGSTTNELPPSSEPNSPADKRNISGSSQPPAYEQKAPIAQQPPQQQQAPLQTQNLPQQGGAAGHAGQNFASPTGAGNAAPTSAGAVPPNAGSTLAGQAAPSAGNTGLERAPGQY